MDWLEHACCLATLRYCHPHGRGPLSEGAASVGVEPLKIKVDPGFKTKI
jgi:hypothetical protein